MKELVEQGNVQNPQNGNSEKQVCVSEWDASVLRSLRELLPCTKDGVDKLGVVLEELVNMLDLDGSGLDVYLLQYVVDARQSLRAILQLLDDSDSQIILPDGQK